MPRPIVCIVRSTKGTAQHKPHDMWLRYTVAHVPHLEKKPTHVVFATAEHSA